MADLRIAVPESTTNYVKNPVVRYATTGWNAFGSAITRSLVESHFGISSLRVVTNGSALYEGAYYRINWLSGISSPLTGSVYVRGSGIIRVRLIEGMNQSYTKKITLQNKWQRVQVLGRCTGGNDVRLYIETDQRAQALTFYVAGAVVEPKSQASTYVDGDQPGCRWSGVRHESISTREAATREGGRWLTLSGKERVEEDLYMTVVGGLGVAPIVNNTQPYATAPGGFYQNTKVVSRVFTLAFHVKHKALAAFNPSLRFLHQLRNALFEVLKPDRTRNGQEFLLEYKDGDIPMYLRARYEGGMEGEWDVRNQWVNSFPVRFLSMYPYLVEDDQETDALNYVNNLGVLNAVAGKIDGAWSNLNYGLNSTVRGMTLGPDGKVYAFGDFLFANSNALAISPSIPAAGIAWWDGQQWNALGTGAISSGGYIADAVVAPNGYVYVTGSFSSIGGVAAANVAYWNGSAWNALGTGLNSYGLTVEVSPNGRIYVGGNFTTAGGNNAFYCAYWDGAWHSLGTYAGLNNIVEDIVITPDGISIYFCGQFTDERTNPLTSTAYVALYTVSSNTFSVLGTGMDGIAYSMALAQDNSVYVTGAFTTAGGATVDYAAVWNGSSWRAIGTGLNASGLIVTIASNGDVYVGGNFTVAGDTPVSYAARWNGSAWMPLDIDISITATPSVQAILLDTKGDLFLGGSGFSTGSKSSKTSAITNVTNIGSAETSPILYILGPGTMKYLQNQTSQKTVQFDLEILDDEEIFMDFGRGTIKSTVRGNLTDTILKTSSFRDFTLLPGDNKIATYMLNDVASYMQLTYIPTHWGADYTEVSEEL